VMTAADADQSVYQHLMRLFSGEEGNIIHPLNRSFISCWLVRRVAVTAGLAVARAGCFLHRALGTQRRRPGRPRPDRLAIARHPCCPACPCTLLRCLPLYRCCADAVRAVRASELCARSCRPRAGQALAGRPVRDRPRSWFVFPPVLVGYILTCRGNRCASGG
jgi:hypothetical protein